MKSLGLVIFILGVVSASYFAVQSNGPGLQEDTFKKLWAEDIKNLESSGKLPPGWSDLNTIEVQVTSSNLKPWLEKYSPDFPTKSTGKYKLQVFLDDFQEGKQTGIMMQYHLIDLTSQDTVWELGRTILLD